MQTLQRLATGCALLTALAAAAPAEDSKEPEAADKLVPLNTQGTILLDKPGKRVVLKTQVVLREGFLEMLACLKQTKEHESILVLDGRAHDVDVALTAIGAEAGDPVRFVKEVQTAEGETRFLPDYKPPTGQKIDIFLQWVDEKGKRRRVPAQSWIRHATQRWYEEPMETLPADLTIPSDNELRYDRRNKELLWYGPMTEAQRDELLTLSQDEDYQKAIRAFHDRGQPREMQAHWVFAGSGYTVDEQTGERFYQAEGGDFICVANFPSAMIDVAIASSASGQDNLMYEAYTERIPPVGTEVLIELVPVFEKEKERR